MKFAKEDVVFFCETCFAVSYDIFLRASRMHRQLTLIVLYVFLTESGIAQACKQNYIINDKTRLVILSFRYSHDGRAWSSNLLATVVAPQNSHLIQISGQGKTHFRAELAGGRTAYAMVPNLCARSQIYVNSDKNGNLTMNIQ